MLPLSYLYVVENVSDEFVIENVYDEDLETYKRKAKIIRRIVVDAEGNKSIATQETVEDLGELTIQLVKGTNKIYMESFDSLNYLVKYSIINEVTETFVTDIQLQTSIEQSETTIKDEVYGNFTSRKFN